MGRFLAGAAAMLLTTGAGIFAWNSLMGREEIIPRMPVPAMAAVAAEPASEPPLPEASPKSREEKRFARYDKDRDGAITREEYLVSRRKAFAKLDRNGNGVLDFEEYAVKTTEKFAKADADRSGGMTPAEFLTTAVKRKAKPAPAQCRPAGPSRDAEGEESV